MQSFHVEDAGIRDMLQDIAIEEFSHLEMVGKLIEQHTRNADQSPVYRSTLFALRGVGPHFVDSNGNAWTASYLNEGGNVVRDLRANIAAEGGARQTYESLMKLTKDEGTKRALHHLLTREVSHTQMFMSALERIGKLTEPNFGNVAPDNTVDIYFNLSHGEDQRGPWNEPPRFKYDEDPRPRGTVPPAPQNPDDETHARMGSVKA